MQQDVHVLVVTAFLMPRQVSATHLEFLVCNKLVVMVGDGWTCSFVLAYLCEQQQPVD
jgi:hypothetical protein